MSFPLEEFAAVDTGLPHFRPVGPDADVLYVRGAETYLELEPVGEAWRVLRVEVRSAACVSASSTT